MNGAMPRISYIASGHYNILAIDEHGKLWTWGINESQELGDGTDTNRNRPVLISQTLDGGEMPGAVKVAAGSQMSIMLDEQGRIWMWGRVVWSSIFIPRPDRITGVNT
jgi:alpha-tubulin suppressor-like RCC1 family protein